MQPIGTRVWRKGLRQAERGHATGRRATHPAHTTYGQRQRDRDWLLTRLWVTAHAEMTAATRTADQEA